MSLISPNSQPNQLTSPDAAAAAAADVCEPAAALPVPSRSDSGLESGFHLSARWRLFERIGRGAFGDIFIAQQTKFIDGMKNLYGYKHMNKEEFEKLLNQESMNYSAAAASSSSGVLNPSFPTVALKLERLTSSEVNNDDGGKSRAVLKLEAIILSKLQKHLCVARFIEFGRDLSAGVAYLAMSRLGENLLKLRRKRKDGKFSLPTVLRFGMQAIRAIQAVHAVGFIHRDIKPSNFCIGADDSPNSRQTIFIIDFGLARCYRDRQTGELLPARENISGFRGTPRYASVHVHREEDLSRRDDLWSLFYILVEFVVGDLPWGNKRDKIAIGRVKERYLNMKLLKGCPSCYWPFMKYLLSLSYESDIDYNYCYELLNEKLYKLNIYTENGNNMNINDYPYDWDEIPPAAITTMDVSTCGNEMGGNNYSMEQLSNNEEDERNEQNNNQHYNNNNKENNNNNNNNTIQNQNINIITNKENNNNNNNNNNIQQNKGNNNQTHENININKIDPIPVVVDQIHSSPQSILQIPPSTPIHENNNNNNNNNEIQRIVSSGSVDEKSSPLINDSLLVHRLPVVASVETQKIFHDSQLQFSSAETPEKQPNNNNQSEIHEQSIIVPAVLYKSVASISATPIRFHHKNMSVGSMPLSPSPPASESNSPSRRSSNSPNSQLFPHQIDDWPSVGQPISLGASEFIPALQRMSSANINEMANDYSSAIHDYHSPAMQSFASPSNSFISTPAIPFSPLSSSLLSVNPASALNETPFSRPSPVREATEEDEFDSSRAAESFASPVQQPRAKLKSVTEKEISKPENSVVANHQSAQSIPSSAAASAAVSSDSNFDSSAVRLKALMSQLDLMEQKFFRTPISSPIKAEPAAVTETTKKMQEENQSDHDDAVGPLRMAETDEQEVLNRSQSAPSASAAAPHHSLLHPISSPLKKPIGISVSLTPLPSALQVGSHAISKSKSQNEQIAEQIAAGGEPKVARMRPSRPTSAAPEFSKSFQRFNRKLVPQSKGRKEKLENKYSESKAEQHE